MIFDFIKRIFSSDNTQIDSIIMTDPKDLDYSSADCIPRHWSDFDTYCYNGNYILLNLLLSDNPLQNYSTNGYVHSFYCNGYNVSICDQDERWVGDLIRAPKTKEESEIMEECCFSIKDEYTRFRRDHNYSNICCYDYNNIKSFLFTKPKTTNDIIPDIYDPNVINGIKYTSRCNDVFSRNIPISSENLKLYNKIVEFFTINQSLATIRPNGGATLLLPKDKYQIYIWRTGTKDLFELRIFPIGADQYTDKRLLFMQQSDGTFWTEYCHIDGTLLYTDISLAMQLLTGGKLIYG